LHPIADWDYNERTCHQNRNFKNLYGGRTPD